ncbi:hypothetical protein QBC40DRAFT_256874 [Triangularia verruculosa]|uniref:Uncharacterized protein n=1 Tax=Triangularia verruculosa TaxID=2587418 RepID=A0AAN6XDZ6_9PEZI|nr:hypothetical protein QBC40DRAFT_256874 [Triangularia verruculosa]
MGTTHHAVTPFGPEDLTPGAPILTVQLEAPEAIPLRAKFGVTIKVTYTGEVLAEDGTKTTTDRPIIFRSWLIPSMIDPLGNNPPREGFWLFRRRASPNTEDDRNSALRQRDELWEACDMYIEACAAGVDWDGPDMEVPVTKHEYLTRDFTSLRPGETKTYHETLQWESETYLPDDTVPGDRFRFSFTGATMDWWNWGGYEEHEKAQTTVMLPSWECGRVILRENEKNMPTLVIPGANEIEFVIV